jgi:hypothetical protein
MKTMTDIPHNLFDEGDASDLRGMARRIQKYYGYDMQIWFYCDGTNVRVIVSKDGHEVGSRTYTSTHDVSQPARRDELPRALSGRD